MRNVVIGSVFGLVMAFSDPTVIYAQSTDCGHCPPDEDRGCILGCKLSNPNDCGQCWEATESTPCMNQVGGCGHHLILLDGTARASVPGPHYRGNEPSQRQMGTVAVLRQTRGEGHQVVYLVRICDGTVTARTYPAQYVAKQRIISATLTI